MVEPIAATSLLGHRQISGIYHFKNVPNNPKISLSPSWPRPPLTKAQATELTKEAYSFREKDRLFDTRVNNRPRLFDTRVNNRPGLWPYENKADNLTLNNPLLLQERMEPCWLGVIFEWEGVIIEGNPDLEKQAWLVLSEEEGKSPPPSFMLRRIEGMKNEQVMGEVLCWSRDPVRCIIFGNSNQTVEAAHNARMKCVAVASKHPVYEFRAADLVVRRLDELSVHDLKKLEAVEWQNRMIGTRLRRFEQYLDYALNAPMYFVYRKKKKKYIDCAGMSFQLFLSTLDDWGNHLRSFSTERLFDTANFHVLFLSNRS